MRALVFLALLLAAESQAQYAFIAGKGGDPAPGTGGIFYNVPGVPVVNASCDAAFEASLNTTAPGDQGAWTGDESLLDLIALNSDVAPGAGGGVFSHVSLPWLTASGEFMFPALLRTNTSTGIDATNNAGLWTGTVGALQLLLQKGDQAPGLPAGIFFGGPWSPRAVANAPSAGGLIAAVQIDLVGNVDTTNDAGIWAGTPGDLQLVVRSGDPAPGFPAGYTIGVQGSDAGTGGRVLINENGVLAFPGRANNFPDQSDVIWIGPRNNPQPVLMSGDTATNMPAGMTFLNLSLGSLNSATDIAGSGIIAPEIGLGHNVFWRRVGGVVDLVRVDGEPVPGLPSGVTWGPQGYDIGMNAAGVVAFASNLQGTGITTSNDWAIFAGTPGALTMVAREGDQAPGLPAGVVFENLQSTNLAINALDEVAFVARVSGTGVTSSNDRAVFAGTAASLVPVVRTGDTIEVRPGEFKTVAAIFEGNFLGVSNNEDGRRSYFSDSGQVAFFAIFTDSTNGVLAWPADACGPTGPQPPEITSVPPTTGDLGVLYSYDVDATDPNGDTLTYSLDVRPTGMSIDPVSGLIQWTPLEGQQNKVHTITVRVADPGGLYDTQTFDILVGTLNNPPQVTSVAPTTATEGVQYTYDVEATDPDGDTLTYGFGLTPPSGMTIDPATGLIEWTPNSSHVGAFNFVYVVVTDGNGGTADQAFTVEVSAANQAPSITSTAVLAGTEGDVYNYDVDATDPDGDALTYSLDLAPAGMSIDATTGLISWTPTSSQVGSNAVTVRAEDGFGGFATQSFSIEVGAVNQAPSITSSAVLTGTEGDLYNYDVDATDPDGDALTYSLDLAPAGMSIDPLTGLINWTPTSSQVGSNAVTVRAEDGFGGFATQSFSVEVEAAAINQPPLIEPISPVAINEGELLNLDALFSDPDSTSWTATVNYGDGAGSQPVPVDNTHMSISLDHTYVDDGAYPVTVTVTDDGGASASTSFVVTVNNVPPVLDNLVVDPNMVAVHTQVVSAAVDFEDQGTGDTHAATIDWGDGMVTPATVSETGGAGSATGDHIYATPGVYTVTVTVVDDDGGTASQSYQYVVAFDPTSGFVTGGGWFESPQGACQLSLECSLLSGRATFGFVSRYKSGASVPTGNTSFHFGAGDLRFKSENYQWLVVSRGTARFKGTGTVNGQDGYGFVVFATDAEITPSTDTDLIRIKIWDMNNGDMIVYDNEFGMSEDTDPVTQVSHGSIVIHDGK